MILLVISIFIIIDNNHVNIISKSITVSLIITSYGGKKIDIIICFIIPVCFCAIIL